MTDPVLPPRLQAKVDAIKEIEETVLLFAQHSKYPVDTGGNILDMNHLPDVPAVLAFHFTRLGWRCHPEKALIKQRPVRQPGYYADLVAYVDVNAPDEPVNIPEPPPAQELWSVRPEVNETYETRPQ